MDIKIISDIKISSLFTGSFCTNMDGIYHKKILKTLSVVQAIEGSYDVKIDDGDWQNTGEGGVFIAPANVLQEIRHNNGKNGYMQAQWVYIDAVINESVFFDEAFSFPVLLDKKYSAEIAELIRRLREPKDYFDKTYASYRVLEILSACAVERLRKDPIKGKIAKFVNERYADDIKAEDIAEYLYCSTPQVFRYTKKYYGVSPANYVNIIRLAKAELMLRQAEKTITEIAILVGYSDSAYFSKLFKKHYGVSPRQYRVEHASQK